MKRACSAPAGAKAHSVPLWRKITVGIVLAAHLTSSTGSGASPAWWYQRGVITDFTHDDYAVINAGQLKNAIRAVVDEMEAKVPGGAGTDLTTLVNGWRAENTQVDNEVAVNQGQVKAAVKLVYDRLNAVHNTPGYYPWNGLPSDDFALANVGQLKHLLARDVTLAPNVDQSTAPAMTATHTDADADGLPLWAESLLGTDPANPDSDADGTSDGAEDTDGDGLADAVEILLTTNPQAVDSDGDGIPDGEEDPDGDGLSNLLEVALETNPLLADSDGDGIPDSHEDSDGDGVRNFMELLLGTHPAQVDSNHNGIPDGDEDHDGDGLRNALEEALGTNPQVVDSNNNGVADGDEDTDGDGISNAREAAAGTNPADANSKPPDEDADGVPDAQDAVPYDPAFTHAPSPAPGYYVTLDLGQSSSFYPALGINGHLAWVDGGDLHFWNPATGMTSSRYIASMSRTPAGATVDFTLMSVSPTGLIAGRQYGGNSADTSRPYVYDPHFDIHRDTEFPAAADASSFFLSNAGMTQAKWGPDNKLYASAYWRQTEYGTWFETWHNAVAVYENVVSSSTPIQPMGNVSDSNWVWHDNMYTILGGHSNSGLVRLRTGLGLGSLVVINHPVFSSVVTNQSLAGLLIEGVSGHPGRPWLAATHLSQPSYQADHIWLPRANGYTQHRIYGSREHRDAQQPLIYVGSLNKHGVVIVAGEMAGGSVATIGVWANGVARSFKELMGEAVYNQYASDQWAISGISDNGIIAMTGVRLSDNTRRVLALLPVEFITRKSKESEATVAVQGVGLTNQRPIVKLDPISSSNVSISNGMATVQIKGSVHDAIADNVPEGKGADIESVRILINGQELDSTTVNRQQDGASTAWRQFPCKGVIQPRNVSFAVQSVVTIRVETAPNAAGEIGYDEVQFRFEKQASGGTLVGGGTISYQLHFAEALQQDLIDTLHAKASNAESYTVLTETEADSSVFATADSQFVVRLYSTPNFTNQRDEIFCVVWDAANAYSALGSGGGSSSCVETGAETNTFQYSQTILPIRTGVTYSHTLAEVVNTEPPDAGGNHPFTWRISVSGDAAQIKTKLGGATFDTHTYGGSLMPKGTETRHIIAYLICDAKEENPPLQLLYYDEASQSMVTKTIGDGVELLNLKLIVNQQETGTITLVRGQMEWRTPTGEPVEDIQKLPAQTLVDYINGDGDIEINDDSAQVLRVTVINKDSPRIRVRSSEIPTDFFELSKNSDTGSKQATLKEVGFGVFESEQKIVVYESSPGIETLSDSQWQALKAMGYLAVHNLSAEALQIINDAGLDDLPGEIKVEHHIFNQWQHDTPARYKNFWSKVFDPGTFDVHDFTVEVAQKRHAKFSNPCTAAWKSLIDSVTDSDGNLLPTVKKEDVRRMVVDKAFELAEQFKVPVEKVRRYWRSNPGRSPALDGSKLDALVKLDEGTNPIRWGDPTDHRSLRWKKYAPKAVKRYGKAFLRSMPYLGYAMTAWALVGLASNAPAAISEELDISEEAAQLLLEGKASVKLQFWQPNSPVQTAQLSDGKSVYIGMTHFYAHMERNSLSAPWIVTRVEEGEIVFIETTTQAGVVALRVRIGQEERLHPNVRGLLPGIPEEGKPAPPGW